MRTMGRFAIGLSATLALAAIASAQTNTFPSSGNVGIGTTNPVDLLSVSNGNIRIGNDNGAVNVKLGSINFVRNHYDPTGIAASIDFWRGGSGSEGALAFSTNPGYSYGQLPTERMRIDISGNVGIGTVSPAYTLDIDGVVRSFGVSPGFICWNSNTGGGSYQLGIAGAMGQFASDGTTYTYVDYANTLNIRSYSGGTISRMVVTANGNVGIGTTNPTEKLSVNGRIRAKEVVVETTNWSDNVFDESYQLQSLSDVERQIKTVKHLPGVPSAQEVTEKGVSVGDMQAILLAKIEELTLYVIQQEKEQSAQRATLETQAAEIATLKAENAQLKFMQK